MIAAFDSYYFDTNRAHTVGLVFEDWTSSAVVAEFSELTEGIEDYVPGAFYKRELPCILSLWGRVELAVPNIHTLLIDGYVFLNDTGRAGLGAHLHAALGGEYAVVGVAKSDFVGLYQKKKAVLRGKSLRPLYVSAMGMDLEQAARCVRAMSGAHRLPDLLKALDAKTKTLPPGV